jgi:hypothetical protein
MYRISDQAGTYKLQTVPATPVKDVSSPAQSTSMEDDSDDDSPAVIQPIAAPPLQESMQLVESSTDCPVRSTQNSKPRYAHSIRGAEATSEQATK